MTTYVLVHGAWGGAHGFHLVRPLLTAAGHEVFTPSLTGVGERAHLASPQIGLSTHIADVANCILYEDLRDIVLLGFSYGGMVVTGALVDVADRVRHVVYLDAFVPADGDSVTTMNGGPAGGWPLSGTELTWLVPPSAREFDDPVESERMNPRRVPMPVGCFVEQVRLPFVLDELPLGRTYVRASAEVPGAPGSDVFDRCAAHAAASPAWALHEIATNHMIPNNRPRELADLLLALA